MDERGHGHFNGHGVMGQHEFDEAHVRVHVRAFGKHVRHSLFHGVVGGFLKAAEGLEKLLHLRDFRLLHLDDRIGPRRDLGVLILLGRFEEEFRHVDGSLMVGKHGRKEGAVGIGGRGGVAVIHHSTGGQGGEKKGRDEGEKGQASGTHGFFLRKKKCTRQRRRRTAGGRPADFIPGTWEPDKYFLQQG